MNLQFIPSLDAEPGAGLQALGGAWIGLGADGAAPAWPQQHVTTELLGLSGSCLREAWSIDQALTSGCNEGIRWRRSDQLLFGVIELDETEFAHAASPLQAASKAAYERLFRLLDAQGLPHLWRIWNYLSDINQDGQGLERYRQFNIGRQDAFLSQRRGATGNVPAACAIGLRGGPLSIAFLAGNQPALAIENPRQISAYHYPAEYGPRAPTFSRAALVPTPTQDILFISGTASIIGHQTVHLGDVAAQCRETMVNIATVVDEANRMSRSGPFTLQELSYRVYVRHPGDFARVRDTLAPQLGDAEVVYVQGDICRADLLVEIEAAAIHTLGRS